MERTELAWAAGLFEGEGCISIHGNSKTAILYPQVALSMTDEDVVLRFQRAVGGLGKIYIKPGTNLRLYNWQASSSETAQAVVAMLWPGLGRRRRARAAEVFAEVKASQMNRKTMRRGLECSDAGCTSVVLARGLCNQHYAASRYDARKAILNARRNARRVG